MTSILRFPQTSESSQAAAVDELQLAARHPISRWYVCPLVAVIAQRIAASSVRPIHITSLGVAILGIAVWVTGLGHPIWGALFVWLAWCCDRLDGVLARTQQTASRWGAWLDANVDEAGDIALHAACAACAALYYSAAWPWVLFALFVGAKYLWQYGITLEEEIAGTSEQQPSQLETAVVDDRVLAADPRERLALAGRLRRLAHLPGNADLRVHFLIGTLAFARPEIELFFVSGYFGCRAIARGIRVRQRLRSEDRSACDAEQVVPSHSDDRSRREAA